MLGYGVVGLNIVKALSKRHNVALWIIGNGEAHPQEHEIIKHCIENASYFNHTSPCLRIWHQHDMAMHVGNGIHAGLPIFELNRFSELEKHHLISLDHIIVSSEWAKQVIRDNGIVQPVTVIPFGVDTSLFHPRPEVKLSSTSTNFLNIGKWEVRKGHDILVEAFNKAFEPTDNVNLIMNCYNPFLLKSETEDGNNTWTELYKRSKMGNKITVIPRRLETQVDVANLMNAVDCGVFPSRAEGWNLELLEMMACGKEVIATDYSAHQEFCNKDNCDLMPIDNLEPAYDGIWFKGQGEWAELGDKQIDYLVHAMRLIHNIKQAGGDLYNEAGVKTAEKFTWLTTADKIMETLHERNRT